MDLKQRPSVIFNEIYSLVYDNADLIEILLGENGDLNFVNRLKQLIREKCLKDWMEVFRSGNAAAFDAFFSLHRVRMHRPGTVLAPDRPQGNAGTNGKADRTHHHQGIGVLEIDPYV